MAQVFFAKRNLCLRMLYKDIWGPKTKISISLRFAAKIILRSLVTFELEDEANFLYLGTSKLNASLF